MKIFTYIKKDSSRIAKKNFQLIGGLELWKHLIYELNDLGVEIFIDTDSEKIINQCKKEKRLSNVVAYPRSTEYIKIENDKNNKLSPANMMLENFLDKHVKDSEEIIILTHVTSPFLKKETIEDVIRIYKEGKYDFIHSVNKEKDFGFLENFENPINFNPNVIQRTQDLKPIFFSNGAFFVMTKKVFKKYNNRWGSNIYFYPLDCIQGVEIDYPDDLKLAKIIYGEKNEIN